MGLVLVDLVHLGSQATAGHKVHLALADIQVYKGYLVSQVIQVLLEHPALVATQVSEVLDSRVTAVLQEA